VAPELDIADHPHRYFCGAIRVGRDASDMSEPEYYPPPEVRAYQERVLRIARPVAWIMLIAFLGFVAWTIANNFAITFIKGE
jgi:hypothetical protein